MSELLRIAIDRENPPFTSLNDLTGEPAGFSVDLCRACLAEGGDEMEFVAADGPLMQSIWLAAGHVDAVLDMTASLRRAQWFEFSAAYYVDELAAFALRDGPLWPGLERVTAPLAVKSNSYAEEWLRRRFPRQILLPVDDAERLLAVVEAGRAAAFITSAATGLELVREHGPERFRAVGPTFAPAGLTLAVGRGEQDTLLRQFNRGLAELRADGRYDALLRASALAHV
ncbi:MAG TPA: transporter substrate-binding domain-containing protein [Dehalococcoidia bacterium]|nr:transporter substrate-binding domain-containing protein [Dehalococcoidia bacterium]